MVEEAEALISSINVDKKRHDDIELHCWVQVSIDFQYMGTLWRKLLTCQFVNTFSTLKVL